MESSLGWNLRIPVFINLCIHIIFALSFEREKKNGSVNRDERPHKLVEISVSICQFAIALNIYFAQFPVIRHVLCSLFVHSLFVSWTDFCAGTEIIVRNKKYFVFHPMRIIPVLLESFWILLDFYSLCGSTFIRTQLLVRVQCSYVLQRINAYNNPTFYERFAFILYRSEWKQNTGRIWKQ